MSKPIIFYEGIITPPSEIGAIRNIFVYAEVFLKRHEDFLLETEKDNKDIYYDWLKRTYLIDYITEIVTIEEQVLGRRITEAEFDRVTFNNFQHIINSLFD